VRSIDLVKSPIQHSNFESIVGSITNRELIFEATKDVDTVFHVASQIDLRPALRRELLEVNVGGTQNIIDGCLKNGVSKLIYTSTYDVTFDGNSVSETENAPVPKKYLFRLPYVETKIQAEYLVLSANKRKTDKGNILVTCALRPAHIWGPADILLLKLMDVGSYGICPSFSGGKSSLIYVKNAAHGHLQAADALAPGSPVEGNVYYLCDYIDSFSDFTLRWARKCYPNIRKIGIPTLFAYFLGIGFSTFCILAAKFNFYPEPVWSIFHAQTLTATLVISCKKSMRDFGFKALVSPEQAEKETEAWFTEFHAKVNQNRTKSSGNNVLVITLLLVVVMLLYYLLSM